MTFPSLTAGRGGAVRLPRRQALTIFALLGR